MTLEAAVVRARSITKCIAAMFMLIFVTLPSHASDKKLYGVGPSMLDKNILEALKKRNMVCDGFSVPGQKGGWAWTCIDDEGAKKTEEWAKYREMAVLEISKKHESGNLRESEVIDFIRKEIDAIESIFVDSNIIFGFGYSRKRSIVYSCRLFNACTQEVAYISEELSDFFAVEIHPEALNLGLFDYLHDQMTHTFESIKGELIGSTRFANTLVFLTLENSMLELEDSYCGNAEDTEICVLDPKIEINVGKILQGMEWNEPVAELVRSFPNVAAEFSMTSIELPTLFLLRGLGGEHIVRFE